MTDDKDSIFNRRFLAFYALLLTVAGMAYIACITFVVIPADNIPFANTVLGFIMGTVVASPVAFYFGSSKSSQSAQQAIVAQLAPPPPPAPTLPDPAPVPPPTP